MRIKPPKHLAHCADADGMMEVDGPCHRRFVEELRARPKGVRGAGPQREVLVAVAEKPPKATTVNVSVRKAVSGAVGLAKAALRCADPAKIAAGRVMVAERKAICEACPHLKIIKAKVAGVTIPREYKGCEKCGCAYLSKITDPKASCPVGRWGPRQPASPPNQPPVSPT